jgi:hypothetical protein
LLIQPFHQSLSLGTTLWALPLIPWLSGGQRYRLRLMSSMEPHKMPKSDDIPVRKTTTYKRRGQEWKPEELPRRQTDQISFDKQVL